MDRPKKEFTAMNIWVLWIILGIYVRLVLILQLGHGIPFPIHVPKDHAPLTLTNTQMWLLVTKVIHQFVLELQNAQVELHLIPWARTPENMDQRKGKPTLVTEFTKVVVVDQIHCLSVEWDSALEVGWSFGNGGQPMLLILLPSLGIWCWA